jgi:hypothetical protein
LSCSYGASASSSSWYGANISSTSYNKGGVDLENTRSQHGSPIVEDEQKGLVIGNMQHCMICSENQANIQLKVWYTKFAFM